MVITILCGKYYQYLHLKGEKMNGQEVYLYFYHIHTFYLWQIQDSNPGIWHQVSSARLLYSYAQVSLFSRAMFQSPRSMGPYKASLRKKKCEQIKGDLEVWRNHLYSLSQDKTCLLRSVALRGKSS